VNTFLQWLALAVLEGWLLNRHAWLRQPGGGRGVTCLCWITGLDALSQYDINVTSLRRMVVRQTGLQR
jgi:hypothetical protein